MPDVVTQLRGAGFSDDEISGYMGAQRSQLSAAGFNDKEINDYFGVPNDPEGVPPAVMQRAIAGNEAVKALGELPDKGSEVAPWWERLWQRGQPRSALEKGVAEADTEPMTAAADVARAAGRGFLTGAGNEPIGAWTGPPDWDKPGWQKLAQTGMVMLGLPFEAVIRGGAGVAGAATGAAMEAGKQVGAGEYEDQDVARFLNDYLPALIGEHVPMTRIEKGVGGKPEINTIGRLPRGQDFTDAGNAITNGDTSPAIEAKLRRLYEELGQHPAEIAHDARNDPVIAQSMVSSDKGQLPYTTRTPAELDLLHGYSSEIGFAGFKPLNAVPDEIRYDGGNGVFGKYTYLDPTGRWITSDNGALGYNKAVRVKANFENLFTLTPNNINEFRNVVGDTAANNAQAAAHILEQKGYDGIQIKGFDDLVGSQRYSLNVDGDMLQDQVVAFDPERSLKVVKEVPLPERPDFIEGTDEERAKYWVDLRAAIQKEVSTFRNAPPVEDILTERMPQSGGAAAAPQPSYSDAEQQILSKISIDEKSPERALTWDRLYTNFIDKLYPLSKAVKESQLADLTTENNPYQLARLLAGHVGKADHFLNNGTFDFSTYENNGKSLKEILNPVAKDLNGFRAYATAARALELEGRGIKSGFDFPEQSSAPPLVSTGLDAARTVVAQGRSKFEAPFRDLIAYQNRLSQYLRDSGVLSDAGYKAMIEANKMYVPFSRVMGIDPDARAVGGSSLQARNPIKAIKGSARDIIDPIESIVRNTYHFVEMAERNQVGTKLVDMLHGLGDTFPEHPPAAAAVEAKAPETVGAIRDELDTVLPGRNVTAREELADMLAHATAPDKEGQISILRDGKRETYEVDPELARAMKGLDAQSMSMLERALQFPASTLRAGAVSTPDFWGRHILRDFIYAATTFKEGVFQPLDMGKGMVGLIMKDKDYWDWLKGGGGNISSVGIDRRYLQEDLRKLTGQTGLVGRAWNVLADPEADMWKKTKAVGGLPFQAIGKFVLDPLRAATQFAENVSHLAAFKKSMRATEEAPAQSLREQIMRAAWTSRDTAVDAARMGANMRAYNLITAFANIKLQDTDRVVRAVKDNPLGALVKIGAAVTVPSVALWAANHDDPRYADIPQWEKDLFWIVMTPSHIYRLPKPWAMGMVFGTLPERLLDAYHDHKPDAFKDYTHELYQTLGPEFWPTAMAPIVDQFANRSTFTNRTLIPSAQEKFLPEYQYTPYTTELAKEIGKVIGAFPGIRDEKTDPSAFGGPARALSSPILIENYIRGWTGTLGVYVLNAADAALRKQGILPDPPQPTSTLADIPVIKAFVVRYPSASAQSIQDFYDGYERTKTYYTTWLAKARDGDAGAMQHIQDMGGAAMFVRLDQIAQTLSQHQKTIQDIYKNPQIKPDEKRQLIDQLYGSMIQVAHYGNEAARQAMPGQ